MNKICISNERQNRRDFAPWPSSVKISSRLLTGGNVGNQNGHFGSMFNKYHRASWNCWVQQIPCPIMCNMSKPQLCVSLCSQTNIFSCVDLHKNFPCQLYDLSNLSLFNVPHLDHSSVHQECRKFSMSLDMSLLILFISCFSC